MIKVWIEDDLCIISFDILGESLYCCGYKQVVGKVLMCEIMVVMFLC